MLIYGFKGKLAITGKMDDIPSLRRWLVQECGPAIEKLKAIPDYKNREDYYGQNLEIIIPAQYNIFKALTDFNNAIARDKVEEAKEVLEQTVEAYAPLLDQKLLLSLLSSGEVLCQLRVWLETLQHDYSLNDLKWEIVDVMDHWEKKGYVTISSCNLKKDYWTFSKYSIEEENDNE